MVLGVSDVDRAKAFYENLGWRLDADIVAGDFCGGNDAAQLGSLDHLRQGNYVAQAWLGAQPLLGVDDIDAARDDLIARGVDVSEVFHGAGGPFNNAVENPRRRRRPARPDVPLVCLVRGSGRERLAAPGNRRGFPAANGS